MKLLSSDVSQNVKSNHDRTYEIIHSGLRRCHLNDKAYNHDCQVTW